MGEAPMQPGCPDPQVLATLAAALEARLAQKPGLLVSGICGSQASGKSTLADALAGHFTRKGVPAATLSLDDLYLSRADRQALAARVHPLFATRGPPGTHDTALGLAVIEALAAGEATPLPRFDKLRDEPWPKDRWPLAPSGTRLLVLEGWCLGAMPQAAADLADPVNELERAEDEQCLWRGYANAMLAGPYQDLWRRIDHLTMLAAPGFEVVHAWRREQEQGLLRADSRGLAGMDDKALARFIAHYERLTRHILIEMPARADLLVRLDVRRRPLFIGHG